MHITYTHMVECCVIIHKCVDTVFDRLIAMATTRRTIQLLEMQQYIDISRIV